MADEERKRSLSIKPVKVENNRGKTIFFLVVGGISSIMGFGYSYLNSKRAEMLEITSNNTPDEVKSHIGRMRDGTKLASKAFALSWVFSVSGVSLVAYGVWKWSGATSTSDFRECVGRKLPRITKPGATGRSDFKNLRELAEYIEEEDRKKTAAKNKRQDSTT